MAALQEKNLAAEAFIMTNSKSMPIQANYYQQIKQRNSILLALNKKKIDKGKH